MPTIAEKFEFVKAGAVMVCLKVGTGGSLRHNIQCFYGVFQKNGGRNQNSCNVWDVIAS